MSIDKELIRRGVIVPVFKTKQRNDCGSFGLHGRETKRSIPRRRKIS